MLWWIVLAVVVVGFALAWWTSGRSKGLGRGIQRIDGGRVQGDALRKHGTAGGGGGAPINPGGGGANTFGGF